MRELSYIRYLRVLALLGVVVIHSVAPELYRDLRNDSIRWNFGNIIDSAFRFAVPIFIMISGVLANNKGYLITYEWYKNRLKRLLYPLFFWSVVYVSIRVHSGENIVEVLPLLRTGVFYHLWYVYMIIGVFILVPIIQVLANSLKLKYLYGFIGIWIFSNSLTVFGLNDWFLGIDLLAFKGYSGYLLLGIVLSKVYVNSRYALLLFLLGWISTVIGTYIITLYNKEFVDVFYNYLAPNVVFMSCGVFLIFKNIYKLKEPSGLVLFLDKFSFGIYFIHPVVLIFIAKADIDTGFFVIDLIVKVIIVLFFSSTILSVLSRIKLLRAFLG